MVHLRLVRVYARVDHGRFLLLVFWTPVHKPPLPKLSDDQLGSHVLCGLVGFVLSYLLFAEPKANDLLYARQVCEAFLTALDNDNLESAHQFTTKRLQQRLTRQSWSRGQGKLTWSIDSQAISESRTEVAFHGTWTFQHGVRQRFVVTVLKQQDPGSGMERWLVDGYTFSNPL